MSLHDRPPGAFSRLRSSPIALIVIAAAAVALVAGVLMISIQQHRARADAAAKAKSGCDTPPAAAPAPSPTADKPPNFVTFAACGDEAKPGSTLSARPPATSSKPQGR
jgi:hypothetical protein